MTLRRRLSWNGIECQGNPGIGSWRALGIPSSSSRQITESRNLRRLHFVVRRLSAAFSFVFGIFCSDLFPQSVPQFSPRGFNILRGLVTQQHATETIPLIVSSGETLLRIGAAQIDP